MQENSTQEIKNMVRMWLVQLNDKEIAEKLNTLTNYKVHPINKLSNILRSIANKEKIAKGVKNAGRIEPSDNYVIYNENIIMTMDYLSEFCNENIDKITEDILQKYYRSVVK